MSRLIAALVAVVALPGAAADPVEHSPTPTAPGIAAPGGGDEFRSAAIQHGGNASDPAHAGIWKAVLPAAGTTPGEFQGNDPLGLAAGVTIKADCSINWVDPDSGKRYCFASATSMLMFLDAPHSYLARAMTNWERVRADTPR